MMNSLSARILATLMLLSFFSISLSVADDSNPSSGHYSFDTGHEITALAVVAAAGHRGSAKIVVAHDNAGARLYNYDGTLLWQDDSPAKLVASYPGKIIIFRDHEEATRLDTYAVSPSGNVSFLNTASPSPLAATTIQRTSFSAVGPIKLRGNRVYIGEEAHQPIELNERVSAFAAVKQFIPLTNKLTHLYALESGKIVLAEIN